MRTDATHREEAPSSVDFPCDFPCDFFATFELLAFLVVFFAVFLTDFCPLDFGAAFFADFRSLVCFVLAWVDLRAEVCAGSTVEAVCSEGRREMVGLNIGELVAGPMTGAESVDEEVKRRHPHQATRPTIAPRAIHLRRRTRTTLTARSHRLMALARIGRDRSPPERQEARSALSG